MRAEISESGKIMLQIPIGVATLVVVVLTVLTILCVFDLLRQKGKCQDDQKCTYPDCKELVKKDLRHVIIFFSTIIIFICVGLLTGNQTAMDYFSFASTITSIVLSVVAIIMTISSESKSEGVKQQIDNSVRELENAKEAIQKYSIDMQERAEKQETTFNQILKNSESILRTTEKISNRVNEIPTVNMAVHEEYQAVHNEEYKDAEHSGDDGETETREEECS